MCKRNYPNKNEASTGCVTETPQIEKEKKKKEKKKKSVLKRTVLYGMLKRTETLRPG